MDMFTRITVNRLHRESHRRLGILHAVRYLRDDKKLTRSELARANRVFDWLYAHVDAPTKKTLRNNSAAVSWFRSDALQHIKRLERLIPIVEAHGYVAGRRTSSNPGKIVYSDDVQVFAIGRSKTQPAGCRQGRNRVSVHDWKPLPRLA
jgi:hypothetical protein